MAKRKSAPYMSAGEQIAGTAFFVIYLVVLPFVTGPLFRLAGGLLGITISQSLQKNFPLSLYPFGHSLEYRFSSSHLANSTLFSTGVWSFSISKKAINRKA